MFHFQAQKQGSSRREMKQLLNRERLKAREAKKNEVSQANDL